MKKIEIEKLIRGEIAEIKIDEFRKLRYWRGDGHMQAVDNLELRIKLPLGRYVFDCYQLDARTPAALIAEVKQKTVEYFDQVVEEFNGVKVLPQNWED